MRYLYQFGIILIISFIGEILNYVLPLPIPASIYGIVIMFLCLVSGIIKLESVKETGKLLVDLMPIMFVPPSVALLDAWPILKPVWVEYVFIAVVTTFIVMAAAGWSAQLVIRFGGKKNKVSGNAQYSAQLAALETEENNITETKGGAE